MGHKNLDLYYRNWADHPELGHVAQRMLAYMVHRASDDAHPPVYYGGWEYLAVAAGITRGTAGQNTMKASVRRALRELKLAGAVVSSGQAGPGVRENYALTLDSQVTFEPQGSGRNVTWIAVDRPNELPNGDTSDIPNGDTSDIPNGDTSDIPNGDTSDIGMAIHETSKRRRDVYLPKEDQSNSNESLIEHGSTNSSQVTTLRAARPVNEDDDENFLTPEEHRNQLAAELRRQYANTDLW